MSMSEQPQGMTDPADRQELEQLFSFLGRIQAEPQLREQINWMQTAVEVSELATAEGQRAGYGRGSALPPRNPDRPAAARSGDAQCPGRPHG
jgi:hypothetical protein